MFFYFIFGLSRIKERPQDELSWFFLHVLNKNIFPKHITPFEELFLDE